MRKKNKTETQPSLFPGDTHKTLQVSTYQNFVAKHRSWRSLLEYEDLAGADSKVIDKIIMEMQHWFMEHPDHLKHRTIEGFLAHRFIRWETWNAWVEKFPNLSAAYAHVLMVLADRRENGLLDFEMHAGAIMYCQRHYSQIWAKLAAAHKEDKQPATAQAGNITVVLDQVPDSPLVPEKKSLKDS